MYEQFLDNLWQFRLSYLYIIMYQPKGGGRIVKQQQQLKSKLLIVDFYLIFRQIGLKRAHFPLVFPTYIQLSAKLVV